MILNFSHLTNSWFIEYVAANSKNTWRWLFKQESKCIEFQALNLLWKHLSIQLTLTLTPWCDGRRHIVVNAIKIENSFALWRLLAKRSDFLSFFFCLCFCHSRVVNFCYLYDDDDGGRSKIRLRITTLLLLSQCQSNSLVIFLFSFSTR